jgi:hypothetical protein
MQINKENVSLFVTGMGMIIGEVIETDKFDVPGEIKINYPMLLVPSNGGVNITNIFMKEEWMIISKSGLIELAIAETIVEGYLTQVQQFHSKIVLPNSNIQKVIM